MFSSLKAIIIFLAVGAGVVIFVLMIVFGQADNESIAATWNKLKPGDSVFAEDSYLTDTGFIAIPTYRLIRPLKKEDVQKMNIPEWQKLKLIAQTDTTSEHAKPAMIEYKLAFLQELMFKKNTAALGSFIKSDSTSGEYKETIYIPLKWHAIKPNLGISDSTFKFKMPLNYIFADSNTYISVRGATIKQPNLFKSQKH